MEMDEERITRIFRERVCKYSEIIEIVEGGALKSSVKEIYKAAEKSCELIEVYSEIFGIGFDKAAAVLHGWEGV